MVGEVKTLFSLTLLSVAAASDMQSFQISNRLIVSGILMGCIFQVQELGVGGVGIFLLNVSIPVILFYPLFLIRALGAGDIKLFSMIGSIWGLQVLCTTIAASFLAAAAMSLFKVLFHRNLTSRLRVFAEYISAVLASGRLLRYPQESQGKQHVIHFSIAVLIGYAIAMEVAY